MKNNIWDSYLENRNNTATDYDLILSLVPSSGNVLDMGCGNGVTAMTLAQRARLNKKCRFYAMDPSKNNIKELQAKKVNIDFKVGIAEKTMYPDNFFDLIYSIDVIEHVVDPVKMLEELFRILKPTGTLFIQTPNYPIKRVYDLIYNYYGRNIFKDDPTHVSKLNYFSLKRYCARYFNSVAVHARNILGEKKIPFIKALKRRFIGKLLAQKLIIICKK